MLSIRVNEFRRLVLTSILTVCFIGTSFAERVAPSPQSKLDSALQMSRWVGTSPDYWIVLLSLTPVALILTILLARKKNVSIGSVSFILPATLVVMLFLGITYFQKYTQLMIELAESGYGGELCVWARLPMIIGSKSYGAAILLFGWIILHPLLLIKEAPMTRGKAFLSCVPLVGVAVLFAVWVYLGFLSYVLDMSG